MKAIILGIIALIAFSTAGYSKSCFNNLNQLTEKMLDNQAELYLRGESRNDYCEVTITKSANDNIEFVIRSEHFVNEFNLNPELEMNEKDCKVSAQKLEAKAEYNTKDENIRLQMERQKDQSIQIEVTQRPAKFSQSIGQTKRAICKIRL